MQVLKRYMPDGSVRGVWDDVTSKRERSHGFLPHRASRIEATETGLFHVDFSPLADITNREDFRVCLVSTFERYEDARKAEVAWLLENYVLEGISRKEG